jgi:cell division protein FtsL
MEFNIDSLLLVLFGIVILFLLFLLYLMQRRVFQLLNEVDELSSTMTVTCGEIEELTKNVNDFKKNKI